jgi:hypothetical protein
VGYLVVVAALLWLGPSHDRGVKQPATSSHLPHAPHP